MTPLSRAVKVQDVAEVKRLLASGHDVNAPDEYGETPIMTAASKGHTAIIEVLLDAGANPNVAWPEDWSPIARATAAGSHRAVVLLLKRGVDPTLRFHQTTVATFVRNRWPDRPEILGLLGGQEAQNGKPAV
jgi:ankyrin repeat protein